MLQRPGAAHKFVRKSEKHLKLCAHKSNSTRMNHAWSLFPEHCHRACGFSFVCFSEISDEIPHVFFHLIFRRHVASFTNSRERNKTAFSRFKVVLFFRVIHFSFTFSKPSTKIKKLTNLIFSIFLLQKFFSRVHVLFKEKVFSKISSQFSADL